MKIDPHFLFKAPHILRIPGGGTPIYGVTGCAALKGMFLTCQSLSGYVSLPNLNPESLRGYVFLMDLTEKSPRGYIF